MNGDEPFDMEDISASHVSCPCCGDDADADEEQARVTETWLRQQEGAPC
jgi:hypothetical protein